MENPMVTKRTVILAKGPDLGTSMNVHFYEADH